MFTCINVLLNKKNFVLPDFADSEFLISVGILHVASDRDLGSKIWNVHLH